jgi:hypothetical protein
MKHSDCCNAVRLLVSEAGGLCLPYNVGALEDASGRIVKFGLPGASDLIACVDGRSLFIEVKVGKDRQRPEQMKFQAAVERAGGRYVLARWPGGEDTIRLALAQGNGRQNIPARDQQSRPLRVDNGRPGESPAAVYPDQERIYQDQLNPPRHEGG